MQITTPYTSLYLCNHFKYFLTELQKKEKVVCTDFEVLSYIW